jgi:hypothetical protein
MKVSEFIKVLEALDQEKEIAVFAYSGCCCGEYEKTPDVAEDEISYIIV